MAAPQRWGTRLGLVLTVAGNAVGLGNFLRFPAQAAQNGGGAFLIPYLVSFVLMGIPLLWVEWAIGRHGGRFGHHCTPGMFDHLGRYRWLKYIGVFGLFTNLTMAAYYCYLESWTLAYVFHSIIGTFRGNDPQSFFNEYLGMTADSIFAFPAEAFFWFVLTIALNVWILSRGIARGVELVCKIGLPLLAVFAVILAVRGLTLTTSDPGVVESPLNGLNFVWQPRLDGLANPTTWLAAAGQVFFTLSLGMGTIHCYAAYLRHNDDIALNASAAGWTNEFIEVVLGGSLLIPIATAYLGLAAIQAGTTSGSGFSIGFLTLPTLFNQWGWFAPVAGGLWFGLLFLAGLTSSIAMGPPLMAFLEDEFGWRRVPTALLFGAITLVLGFFCVWLYPGGSFDEFDYWTGTFSLVVFALAEVFIFAYIFGMDRGWEEITRGADMRVPVVFRYVIKYITPAFILIIFIGSLIQPQGRWADAIHSFTQGDGWPLAPNSVIGKLLHVGEDGRWFDDAGRATRVLVIDTTRLLLTLIFVGLSALVWKAWRNRRKAAA